MSEVVKTIVATGSCRKLDAATRHFGQTVLGENPEIIAKQLEPDLDDPVQVAMWKLETVAERYTGEDCNIYGADIVLTVDSLVKPEEASELSRFFPEARWCNHDKNLWMRVGLQKMSRRLPAQSLFDQRENRETFCQEYKRMKRVYSGPFYANWTLGAGLYSTGVRTGIVTRLSLTTFFPNGINHDQLLGAFAAINHRPKLMNDCSKIGLLEVAVSNNQLILLEGKIADHETSSSIVIEGMLPPSILGDFTNRLNYKKINSCSDSDKRKWEFYEVNTSRGKLA